MNAIPPLSPAPDRAARTADHLGMLAELSRIGMALARAIGQQALAALEAPAPEPPDPAPAREPVRADPGLAFARIARAVRQTIALEARILADRDAPPRPPRSPHPADPRRETIRRVVHDVAKADTRTALSAARRREIDERLDDELDADPGQDIPVDDIIVGICDDLGLGQDLSRVPDEFLAILGRAHEPPADAASDPPVSAPLAPAPPDPASPIAASPIQAPPPVAPPPGPDPP